MNKTKVKMNRPVYLGLSIFDIIKVVMRKFWNDYIKSKYQDNAKLCYMDTDSFIVYVKTENIYIYIAEDAEERFDTSNYETEGPLSIGKDKKMTGLGKDELRKKIMTEFVGIDQKHILTR